MIKFCPMVGYRRNKTANSDDIFFLAIVCANRHPFFNDPVRLDIVRAAMNRTALRSSIEYKAWVILPDHLHLLLRPKTADYSTVISSFKRIVTSSMRNRGFTGSKTIIWQDRFWEHTIRDDADLERSVNYIHSNPVKHGHARTPIEWEYSSIHKFILDGHYGRNWTEWMDIKIDGADYDI